MGADHTSQSSVFLDDNAARHSDLTRWATKAQGSDACSNAHGFTEWDAVLGHGVLLAGCRVDFLDLVHCTFLSSAAFCAEILVEIVKDSCALCDALFVFGIRRKIMLFGPTGGLIPCLAAITVLLLCMPLKQLSLGFVLIVCFSIGLALTMISAGVLAALSIKHVSNRWSGFSTFTRRTPYASAALIVFVGLYTGWLGWQGIQHVGPQQPSVQAVLLQKS
jgi:hypothetical protein